MIYADRTNPLPAFIDFVKRQKPVNWDGDFVTAEKQLYRQCRDELLKKQNGISAYIELPLTPDGKIHIDHFRRKGIPEFAGLTFCWTNLIVDTKDETDYGAGYKDLSVNSQEDYINLINPAELQPERYFTYLVNGKMVPARDINQNDAMKAEYTINIFNLNHPSLISMRHQKIMSVQGYLDASIPENDILEYMKDEGFITAIRFALQNL